MSQELSATLIFEPPARRSRVARRWIHTRLREIVQASETQTVLCTAVLCIGIDLLFEPTLQLDPLKLLRDASRATRIVVAWPGSYSDDTLTYALPEHGHYRTWRRPDAEIVRLEAIAGH